MCIYKIGFCPCCKIFDLTNLRLINRCGSVNCTEIIYKVSPLTECDICVLLCTLYNTCEQFRRIPKFLVHNKTTDVWLVSFYWLFIQLTISDYCLMAWSLRQRCRLLLLLHSLQPFRKTDWSPRHRVVAKVAGRVTSPTKKNQKKYVIFQCFFRDYKITDSNITQKQKNVQCVLVPLRAKKTIQKNMRTNNYH